MQDGIIDDDTLHNDLDKVMAEARNARQEAFQETFNRLEAEKNAVDAIRKVNPFISFRPFCVVGLGITTKKESEIFYVIVPIVSYNTMD